MTVQLQSELESKKAFKKWCEDNHFNITREWNSHENKLENSNADFSVKTDYEYTVSLKTEGGLFTSANLGTGFKAIRKWCSDEDQINELRSVLKEVSARKNYISANYNRWEDVPNSEDKKKDMVQPLIDFYFNLFQHRRHVIDFCRYLMDRNADFLWVDGSLIHIKSYIPKDFNVTKVNSKSILIPDVAELRFKSEGGKVSSSIKLNVQPCK